jgi:hypothetical protein
VSTDFCSLHMRVGGVVMGHACIWWHMANNAVGGQRSLTPSAEKHTIMYCILHQIFKQPTSISYTEKHHGPNTCTGKRHSVCQRLSYCYIITRWRCERQT